jgi:hypothetical protein
MSLLVADVRPAFAYLKFGVAVDTRQVTVKWARTPIRYFVNSGPGVAGVAANDLQSAAARAFSTWQSVAEASVSYQFVGMTSARPGDDDGQSTLGFDFHPELNRVLASTSILLDVTTGEIAEADIFFNTAFSWSVAPAGESGKFDLESIALHEIGHMSGLGHSAIGETEMLASGGRRVIASEAVMFPIAFAPGTIVGRNLKADDIAGISDLYPGAAEATGSISGRVTRDGRGVFGAHIVAFDAATSTLVGNFSLDSQGRFTIARLSPGPHIVRLEPLDDADIDSFFDAKSVVDIDFRASFFERLVVVPRNGDSGSIELKVVPK